MLAVFIWCAAAPVVEKDAAPLPDTGERLATGILADGGNPWLLMIAASYSPRNFAKGEVKDFDIECIVTSGVKAPSAKNSQPWHFTVVKNYEKVASLTGLAKEGNALIIISGRRDAAGMQFDCGLAAQNINLAAQSLGLGARMLRQPLAAIRTNQDALGIPQGYDAVITILIGHTGDTPLDAAASASPRDPLSSKVNYVR